MKFCAVHLTILVFLNLSFQQSLLANPAQRHLVSREALHGQLISQSNQRAENIKEIQKLLHNDLVQQEVGSLLNLEKVELALDALDDKTLDELAIKSREVNDQIEAISDL